MLFHQVQRFMLHCAVHLCYHSFFVVGKLDDLFFAKISKYNVLKASIASFALCTRILEIRTYYLNY